ncbi:MAG: hypothetical protein ACREAB_06855 [Blastocatellia bacterium]
MKLTLICLLLIGSSLLVAGQDRNRVQKSADSDGQVVERKYNRINDETTVTLKRQRILDNKSPRQVLEMSAKATFKGEQPTELFDAVEVTFTSSAEKSPYSESVELNFIVDGERVRGALASVGRSYNPAPLLAPELKLAEDIIAFVNVDAFRKVVGGKKVEMQLGTTELTLDTTTLNNLRKFASSVFGK